MTDSKMHHPAVAGCVEACSRCRETARLVAAAENGAYREIGPHLRHCLDHFVCLLRGLSDRVIDYDARDRNEVVETDPAVFQEALNAIITQLRAIDSAHLSQTVLTWQTPAPGEAPISSASTLERELLFVSGHAIHHLATISVIAKAHGIAIPDSHCLAFSTAAHRASLKRAEA